MRLIDANALPVYESELSVRKGKRLYFCPTEAIMKAPTIDAVEVVRCRDCKWRNWETNGCDRNPCVEPWFENDFCSYGERERQ